MKAMIPILLIVISLLGCKSDNKDAESYFNIRDAYKMGLIAFQEKFKTVSTEEEQKTLMKEAPDRKGYLDTLLYFIDKNPEKEFITDVWVEVYKLRWFGRNDTLLNRAIGEITEKHSKSKYLENFEHIMLTKSRNPGIETLMETVLNNNESKEVKGIFSFAYANWLTKDKSSKHFNLEKGLALYDTVIEKYGNLLIKGIDGNNLSPIGPMAESAKRNLTELAIGKKAPEVLSKDLQGNEVKLSDYLGKVVMMDIWATWCGPCIKMIPDETEMVKKLAGSPFELISISVDKEAETVEKFHKKNPMPWTHWFNGEKGGVLTQWNIFQYPTVIILDKEGIIRHRFDGAVSKEKLDKAINDLLEI